MQSENRIVFLGASFYDALASVSHQCYRRHRVKLRNEKDFRFIQCILGINFNFLSEIPKIL